MSNGADQFRGFVDRAVAAQRAVDKLTPPAQPAAGRAASVRRVTDTDFDVFASNGDRLNISTTDTIAEAVQRLRAADLADSQIGWVLTHIVPVQR